MTVHSRPRRGLLALGALAVLAAAALTAGPARAQEEGRLVIRSVDTSEFPAVVVEVQLAGAEPRRDAFSLREAGRLVPIDLVVPVEREVPSVSVVLAIDRSGSMANNDAIGQARLAARTFVDGARPDDRVGLIAFDTFPEQLATPTDDHDSVRAAIDTIEADGFTALWDTIILGSGMLADAASDERYLVVMSDVDADSYDNASQGTAQDALAAAREAGVSVLAVGLPLGPVDDRELRTVVDGTGGLLLYADDPTQLGSLFTELQTSLRTSYELRYRSRLDLGEQAELLLTVGASQAEGEVAAPDAPEPVDGSGSDSDGGLPVPLLVVAVAAVAAVGGVVVLRRR